MPVIFTLPEKKPRDLRKSGQRKVQWRRKQIEEVELSELLTNK